MRTDPEAPKHRGISFLLMEKDLPGISLRPLFDMSGHYHFNETFFEDVRVPATNVVGELNRGLGSSRDGTRRQQKRLRINRRDYNARRRRILGQAMKLSLALLLVAGFWVVGCGGGGDDEPAAVGSDQSEATAASTDGGSGGSDDDATGGGASTATPTSDLSTSSGGAAGTAMVKIGDRAFDFDVTPSAIQRCDSNFFGAFWALSQGGLDLLVAADDDPNHDPPYVKVTDPDNRDIEWWADSTINESLFQIEVPEGQSQVDSFTVEGGTVTGTATFIEKSALISGGPIPDSVEGTFSVTCAE